MLSYRRNTLALDFFFRRSDGSLQLLEISIEKHCSMYDTGLRFEEKRIAGDLLSIHEHIIPAGTLGIQPYRLEIT